MTTKAEAYKWNTIGRRMDDALLPIGDLRIEDYQRPNVSEFKILGIARAFSWEVFGALVVGQRADGSLWVVDGFQRLTAARRRGDIERVPCKVFASRGKEHEAEVFLDMNKLRSCIPAVVQFRDAHMIGRQPQKDIGDWLRSVGLSVGEGGTKHVVDFPRRLQTCWSMDADATRRALLVQVGILQPDEALHGNIHGGLWWLAHNDIPIESYSEKMRVEGGKVALLQAIRREGIIQHGAGGEKVCGMGILTVINFRRHKKIKVGRAE